MERRFSRDFLEGLQQEFSQMFFQAPGCIPVHAFLLKKIARYSFRISTGVFPSVHFRSFSRFCFFKTSPQVFFSEKSPLKCLLKFFRDLSENSIKDFHRSSCWYSFLYFFKHLWRNSSRSFLWGFSRSFFGNFSRNTSKNFSSCFSRKSSTDAIPGEFSFQRFEDFFKNSSTVFLRISIFFSRIIFRDYDCNFSRGSGASPYIERFLCKLLQEFLLKFLKWLLRICQGLT